MISKKYALDFPPTLSGKPLTYVLVKEYDLVVNILRARITPEDAGRLVVELSGEEEMMRRGLEYLAAQGVVVEPHTRDIIWLTEQCVDCGACTGVCRVDALTMNTDSWKLEFDKGKCVLCGACVDACPVAAIKVEF